MKRKFYMQLRWLALKIMVHHYERFKKWHEKYEQWTEKYEKCYITGGGTDNADTN